MKVKVAKTAGFCFGVKRAVELVEQQASLGKQVYTYGPIIHNEEVTGALAKKGVHSLALEVRASNAPAIALYEQLGFQQVGRRPNYYRNPKEDALILKKVW